MIAQSNQSTLIEPTSKGQPQCERPDESSSLEGSGEVDNDDDDEDSGPPSFAEYDADELSSNDNTEFSSSSNTTLNSTPVSQPSLESQLLLFPSVLHRKSLSLLFGPAEDVRDGQEEEGCKALF